ncbi:hypothetical protein [Cryobacterium arcticum]|uniref:Uncharacterized protein n=1 Tax=Cryobacterium arcticum TaxID=670052 RepID=A0A1B1BPM8_9MICO|nr:hypothetical protein [Cryobacterium arcticum]ANP74517.1 hypothetical protein PA27867_3598 [Cryobacterium arcticum]
MSTNEERDALAQRIWETSRADEGSISVMGANVVADALISAGYAREVTNQPPGFTLAGWHVDATLDAGTDHITNPRQYVVQCEWCRAVFWGPRKADAMMQMEAHREDMYDANEREREVRRFTPTPAGSET